jgi:hypothetical protein
VVHIRHKLGPKSKHAGPLFAEPKTHKARRDLPLPQVVVDAVAAQRAVTDAERALVPGWRDLDLDLVFPSSVGTPLNESHVLARFQQLPERAGLPKRRMHDLRHTSATRQLSAAASPCSTPPEPSSRRPGPHFAAWCKIGYRLRTETVSHRLSRATLQGLPPLACQPPCGRSFSRCAPYRPFGLTGSPRWPDGGDRTNRRFILSFHRSQGTGGAEGYSGQLGPEHALSRPRSVERSEGSLDQQASDGTTISQSLRPQSRTGALHAW